MMVRRSILRSLVGLVAGSAAGDAVVDGTVNVAQNAPMPSNRTPEWMRPGWDELQRAEAKNQTRYHHKGLDCDLYAMKSPGLWWKHAVQRNREKSTRTWFAKLRHKVWNL